MPETREELPPTKPTEEESAVLTKLTELDAIISTASHISNAPGDGLLAFFSQLLRLHGHA